MEMKRGNRDVQSQVFSLKSLALLLLFLAALACPIFAYELDDQVYQLEMQTSKVKAEMIRLDKQAKKYPPGSAKSIQISNLLDGQRARLEKLDAQLNKLQGPQEIVVSDEPIQLTQEVEVIAEPVAAEEPVPEGQPALWQRLPAYAWGINFGAFAGATSVNGETRIKLPYIRDAVTSSSRVMLGYAVSRDGTRKYVPFCLDVMLNYPPGYVTGVDNYLGAGLNYVVMTSGRVAGTVGGQLFYGVESEGFGGKLFGELGYGTLCTGFSAPHQGVTLLIGYRKI